MASLQKGHGLCPVPFLELSQYPYGGGFEPGRLCNPTPSLEGNITCCLPCPLTDLVYPDNFEYLTRVANWLNVGSTVCCILLLVSFVVLPVAKTRRHYLTVCLIVAVSFLSLSFIIPLGSKPDQCHDAITPNDMKSDPSCAASGFFLLFGGLATVMWVFLRSLSLHLQICWDITPGRRYFYAALLAGWAVPALLVSLALAITEVSYRFGDVCHINHDKSVQTFWGPALALAGAATILQFTTFGYCIRVYIRSLLAMGEITTESEAGIPSSQGSVRTRTARAAYRRVKKVVALHWRGIVIVLIIIGEVVFFSVVFMQMDSTTQSEMSDISKVEPWLFCLVEAGGDKNACLQYAKGLVKSEATVISVLILLSLTGVWGFLFLGRWTMIPAWIDFFRVYSGPRDDFVSVDSKRLSDSRTYEMLQSPPQPVYKSPEITTTNMSSHDQVSQLDPKPIFQPQGVDYFGREAEYHGHSYSFSNPKPPSRAVSAAGTPNVSSWKAAEGEYTPSTGTASPNRPGTANAGMTPTWPKEWDPISTYARGTPSRSEMTTSDSTTNTNTNPNTRSISPIMNINPTFSNAPRAFSPESLETTRIHTPPLNADQRRRRDDERTTQGSAYSYRNGNGHTPVVRPPSVRFTQSPRPDRHDRPNHKTGTL
ncbi:hypothetical protein MMC09_001461 [Bachmanniomyces sp. S44760]|nr:hypothetical protein [Bachmanniomyces sp. S44760]